jgi:acyl carrier protein
MTDEVLTKVQEIFGELFDIHPQVVSLQTKAADVPGWDSVGHLSLCGVLEETFEIRLDTSEFAEMNDVRTIVTVVKSRKRLSRQSNCTTLRHMKREGTLHIVRLDRDGSVGAEYSVAFSDYSCRQNATTLREIVTEDALRKFLAEQLKIHPDAVAVAIQHLKTEGSADIFHTSLTDEELSALGLMP